MENLRVWADRERTKTCPLELEPEPEPCTEGQHFLGVGAGKVTAGVRGRRPGRHSGRGTALAPARTTPLGAGPAAGPPEPRRGGQARLS